MIPVGAGLADGETVGESDTRLDRRVGHEGDTIHVRRDQQAVPVDGSRNIHRVGDVHHSGIPVPETQCRPGDAAVDGHPHHGLASDVHLLLGDGQVVNDFFGSGNCGC